MNKRYLNNFFLLFAIGFGLFSGWLNNPFIFSTASVVSDIFLKLLKLISIPIIFLAVSSTITGMRNFQEMKQMGWRILFYTFLTTIIAATIALLIFISVHPASGMEGTFTQGEQIVKASDSHSYLSFVFNLVPSNVFEAFASNNVIGVVFISIFFSFSVLFLPVEQKNFLHQLFSSLFAAVLKMTRFVLVGMPVAIWAFMTLLIKDIHGNNAHFHHFLLYLCCVVGANVIQGVVVLPLLLKIKKISPWNTFRSVIPALTVAFFSKSSNATLPVAMQSIENNLGVSRKVSSFSLPLCSVINMNGCAAFILTTVLFVTGVYGIQFSGLELIAWIFLATLAAIGNAGVPMGCFFLTSAFLIGMDIPLTLMGFILPFYTFLDMIETSLNVWSDCCVTTALQKDMQLQPADDSLVLSKD